MFFNRSVDPRVLFIHQDHPRESRRPLCTNYARKYKDHFILSHLSETALILRDGVVTPLHQVVHQVVHHVLLTAVACYV